MIVWVSWRCSRDGQILALRAALGGQRVAAFPGELAVGEGWLLDLLATADLPLPIPVALDLGLDGNVLAFTLGVSVVASACSA